MSLQNTIVVYDFETTGRDPNTCRPVQIAAVAINSATLKFKDQTFATHINPGCDLATIDEENIQFHIKNRGITKEELLLLWEQAPTIDVVLPQFKSYLDLFNYDRKKSKFGAPIRSGHNNIKYDDIIFKRMCLECKLAEESFFHPRDTFDVMQICTLFFESLTEPKSYSLDNLRTYFGMDTKNSHDALKDCYDTGELLIRFLKLCRRISPTVKFKGAFANEI